MTATSGKPVELMADQAQAIDTPHVTIPFPGGGRTLLGGTETLVNPALDGVSPSQFTTVDDGTERESDASTRGKSVDFVHVSAAEKRALVEAFWRTKLDSAAIARVLFLPEGTVAKWIAEYRDAAHGAVTNTVP